jgi:putative oligomerization/nucleic acid binding protein
MPNRRIDDLVRRYLDPGAVAGLGPALAVAAGMGEDVIALSTAFADRAGLLVLAPDELRFIAADGSDEASAYLDRVSTVETATYDDRPVIVLFADDSRRTMFYVGDASWSAVFASMVNLAIDDPASARVASDQHGGGQSVTATVEPPTSLPGRSAKDRLAELESLRADGAITEAEYAVKRAAILEDL